MYQMVSQFLNYRRGVPRSRSGDFLVIYVIEVSPLTTDNAVVKPRHWFAVIGWGHFKK
jgi:hypothetical protein